MMFCTFVLFLRAIIIYGTVALDLTLYIKRWDPQVKMYFIHLSGQLKKILGQDKYTTEHFNVYISLAAINNV